MNGLVIAGEIALERLQKAGEARVAATGRRFSNHYDLAAHLLSQAATILKGPFGDTAIGRVDLLFDFLLRLDMVTPERLRPYLIALHSDTERRPIAEQVVDQILAEDATRYKVYEDVRLSRQVALTQAQVDQIRTEPDAHEAIGYFLSEWIAFEQWTREQAQRLGHDERGAYIPTQRRLEKLRLLDGQTRSEVERIRRLRNELVHGIGTPNPADIRDAAARLHEIVQQMKIK